MVEKVNNYKDLFKKAKNKIIDEMIQYEKHENREIRWILHLENEHQKVLNYFI